MPYKTSQLSFPRFCRCYSSKQEPQEAQSILSQASSTELQRWLRCCLLQGSSGHPLPALSSDCYFPLPNLTSWYFTVSQVRHFKHLKEKRRLQKRPRQIMIKALIVLAARDRCWREGHCYEWHTGTPAQLGDDLPPPLSSVSSWRKIPDCTLGSARHLARQAPIPASAAPRCHVQPQGNWKCSGGP